MYSETVGDDDVGRKQNTTQSFWWLACQIGCGPVSGRMNARQDRRGRGRAVGRTSMTRKKAREKKLTAAGPPWTGVGPTAAAFIACCNEAPRDSRELDCAFWV